MLSNEESTTIARKIIGIFKRDLSSARIDFTEAFNEAFIAAKQSRSQPHGFFLARISIHRLVVNTTTTRVRKFFCKRDLRKQEQVLEITDSHEHFELLDLLNTLPDKLRDVLMLRYLKQRSVREVAKELKIGLGTAVTRETEALTTLFYRYQ